MAICWKCNKDYETPDRIERDSECPHCASYLRCCRNCGFYDSNVHNACHEPMAELQGDKEVANVCDYFRVTDKIGPAGQKPNTDFGALFKDE
jgi:hypothetical protein